MSHAGTVTRLAVRELWMTFRLVAMLVAGVGAGAIVALIPAPLPTLLDRLAIGLAAATILAAALAAWSVAADRTRGRAAWLVTRSVPRATILGGWFVSAGSVAVLGVGVGAVLGGLAVAALARVPIAPYAAAAGSVAATAVAAVALGCVAGLLVGPRTAAVAAVLIVAGAIGAAWLVPHLGDWGPGHAITTVASADPTSWSVPVSARDAGIALVTTAILLVVGRGIAGRVAL